MDLNTHCAGCFAGLSCDSRIGIINLLKKNNKMSVSEIAKHFKVSQPTITHHLQYLKKIKILVSKKEGRKVYYFIDPKCQEEGCDLFQ